MMTSVYIGALTMLIGMGWVWLSGDDVVSVLRGGIMIWLGARLMNEK